MPQLWQHILVLLLVAVCFGFVIWQGARALVGRRSKLGSCCAKGCPPTKPKQQHAGTKVQFFPAEMLGRRK